MPELHPVTKNLQTIYYSRNNREKIYDVCQLDFLATPSRKPSLLANSFLAVVSMTFTRLIYFN